MNGAVTTSRRRVIGTIAIVVSVVIPPFLVGALAPRIAVDMPFDTGQVGLAMAAGFVTTGVLSPAAGRLVSRIGPDPALRIACAMSTTGLVGIAASTRAAHLVVALAFIGVANALTQPASNDILARVRDPRTRALSFGLVQASIPLGSLLAGALLAVASYGTSWRWSVLAVVALTVTAQAVLPSTPRPVRRHAAPRGVAPTPRSAGRGLGGPVLLAALIAAGFLASAAATAMPSFLATTGHATGLAPWLVAAAQVTGSLSSIVVRVVAPYLSSHASVAGRIRVVGGLQVIGVMGMIGLATGTPAGYLVGSIAAFGFGWGWNGLYNLIITLARPARVAAATGLTQAGIFLGGTSGPLIYAVIAEAYDHRAAWSAMATIMAMAAIATAYASHRARIPGPAPHRPTDDLEERHA